MRATARICDGCGTAAVGAGHAAPAGWVRAHLSWTEPSGVSRQAVVDVCQDRLCAARAFELALDRGEPPRFRVLEASEVAPAESSESGR